MADVELRLEDSTLMTEWYRIVLPTILNLVEDLIPENVITFNLDNLVGIINELSLASYPDTTNIYSGYEDSLALIDYPHISIDVVVNFIEYLQMTEERSYVDLFEATSKMKIEDVIVFPFPGITEYLKITDLIKVVLQEYFRQAEQLIITDELESIDYQSFLSLFDSMDISDVFYKHLLSVTQSDELSLIDVTKMKMQFIEDLHIIENLFLDDIQKHNTLFEGLYDSLGYSGYLVTEPLNFGEPSLKLLRDVTLLGDFDYNDVEVTVDYKTNQDDIWYRRPWKQLLPTKNYIDSISGTQFRVAIRTKNFAYITDIKANYTIIDNRFRRAKEL